MYESRHQPILPRRDYMRRVGRSALFSTLLVGASLGVGVVGYHLSAGLGWLDSLLNASMILTGMGPVSPLHGVAAKLFASGYALFSGVIFIASAGLIVAPVAHRFLHRFHLESRDQQDGPAGAGARTGRPKTKPEETR
jgi:hypothetical protein